MSATYLPSFVTVHLPDGEDVLLEGRVRSGRGSYGLKPGSRQIQPGSASFTIDGYDRLVTRDDDGRIPLDVLARSSMTVGFRGVTLFSGRVRQPRLTETTRKSTVQVTVQDAITEFAGLGEIDLGACPSEQTGQRVHRVLDAVGWGGSAAYRDIAPGTVRCVAIPETLTDRQEYDYGRKGRPVDMLNRIAATEGGKMIIRHGRRASDRVYNRGLLSFRERRPASDPVIHIDTVTAQLDGVGSLRPNEGMAVEPNREELYNRIRLHSPTVDQPDLVDRQSVGEFGERLYEADVLSEGEDTEGLARFMLAVYAQPRDAVKSVRISPYFYPQAVCEKVYALTVGDVVRMTYREPQSGSLVESVQQVNHVKFDLRPGDNTEGGAIADITLELEAPENIAYWKYGTRASSELGSTTTFSRVLEDDADTDASVPQLPHQWVSGENVSAEVWNAHVVNLGVVIYASAAERNRTPESAEAELREELGLQAPGPDGVSADPQLEQRIQDTLAGYVYRERPADDGSRSVPADGVLSVDASKLEVSSYSADTGGDTLIAHVAAGDLPGRWTLDGSVLSRLDYGNTLG